MALDWEPLLTPKRGYEQEFVDLFNKLVIASGARRAQLLEWLGNISVPVFETLGAPRVGFDEAADAWLRERAAKSDRLAELDEIKAEMHGYAVLDLMPPCDGFPVYSHYKTKDELERYSFNAELLAGVSEALGDELVRRAHTMMLPKAHREFADRLGEVATRFAAEHGLPEHVATIREPVFPEGSQERHGHILFAAAKWCAYWSGRGHGLAVWT
jgi:hypothetical protein